MRGRDALNVPGALKRAPALSPSRRPPPGTHRPLLLHRRERRRLPDLVDDTLDEGPIRLRRLLRRLPLRIRHEGRPRTLPMREVVEGADIHELVRLPDH